MQDEKNLSNPLNQDEVLVDPSQTSLFDQKTESQNSVSTDSDGYLEIPHQEEVSSMQKATNDSIFSNNLDLSAVKTEVGYNFEEANTSERNDQDFNEDSDTEDKPEGVNKMKILAALAIVGVAAYAAHWVQEPVQLKADLLSSDTNIETTISEDLVAQTEFTVEEIDIAIFGFTPASLNVEKGTKVVWTNTTTDQHTLIGTSTYGDSFTSPSLEAGETFEYIFENDDEYRFYSTYNPALSATIKVGSGASLTTNDDQQITDADNLLGSALEEENLAETIDTVNNQLLNQLIAEQNNEVALNSETTSIAETENVVAENSVSEDELKAAAEELHQQELAQTGPENLIYLFAFLVIAYFNREKLGAIFS